MKNIRIMFQTDGYGSPHQLSMLPYRQIIVKGYCAASAMRTWMRKNGYNMGYAPSHDQDAAEKTRSQSKIQRPPGSSSHDRGHRFKSYTAHHFLGAKSRKS